MCSPARGLWVGVSVGIRGIQGRDWSIGLELADHIGIYNSGEGIRHDLAAVAFIQLHSLFGGAR